MSNNVVAVSRRARSESFLHLTDKTAEDRTENERTKTSPVPLRPLLALSASPYLSDSHFIVLASGPRRASSSRSTLSLCLAAAISATDGSAAFLRPSRCLLLGCTRYWKLKMQKRVAPSPSASERRPAGSAASAHCSRTEPWLQMQLQISKSLQITIRRSCCVFICASFMNGHPHGGNESRCEADEDGNCELAHRLADRNARDLLRNLQANGHKRNRNKQISWLSTNVMIILLTYFNEFAFFVSSTGRSPSARRERSRNSTTPQVRRD